MQKKQQIIFLLSVDTEEEWDWEGPFPEDNFSVENLHQLNSFQSFCSELGIRPCYFVDYAAAKGLPKQTDFMAQVASNKCEIGAHLHPWANPPYFEPPTEQNSHVVNLPLAQVEQKLDALLALFADELNCIPKAFRSGRWGISEDIMQTLHLRGFDIDSSVYPFYRNEYFDCYGSPLGAYWPSDENVLRTGSQRNIIEMPVTVGFNRAPFYKMSPIHDAAQHSVLRHFRSVALLWHTRMLRKVYFSPEVSSTQNMIDVAHSAIRDGQRCLHMFFHSSNLIANATGLVNAKDPHTLICERISGVIENLQKHYDLVMMTPSEYKVFLQNNEEHIAP
ncbi:MAG: WalW protein [Glaciecola sp.]